MKENQSTKKSLKASALSLVLCAAMLIGTTFAWFTDSVTNKGNVIQSGNLKIQAEAYDTGEDGLSVTIQGVNDDNKITFAAEGRDLNDNIAPIIGDKLFEPGKSNAKLLQISNNGTLATKIKLEFNVTDSGLQDALWFDFIGVKDGAVVGEFTERPMSELEKLASSIEIPLKAAESVQYVLVYGMNEEAGNEYQDKQFTADVKILATQLNSETDGFGNPNYDEDAEYPVDSWDGTTQTPVTPDENGDYGISEASELAWLASQINGNAEPFAGKTITLKSDIDFGNQEWTPLVFDGADSDVTIDGNGCTIKNVQVNAQATGQGIAEGFGGGFIRQATGDITIKNLTFDNVAVAVIKPSTGQPNCNIVGIVMGYAYGTTVFENVQVINSSVTGGGKVGVMLGMGADPGIHVTFKDCVSTNNKITAGYNAGGLAGNIQRKDGVDYTTIENCTVEGNEFIHYNSTHKYVELENQTANFKSNDTASGTDKDVSLNGTYWDNGEYYWGAYGKYYVSYGSSSYDAPITTEGEHSGRKVANSEICINDISDIPVQE